MDCGREACFIVWNLIQLGSFGDCKTVKMVEFGVSPSPVQADQKCPRVFVEDARDASFKALNHRA